MKLVQYSAKSLSHYIYLMEAFGSNYCTNCAPFRNANASK